MSDEFEIDLKSLMKSKFFWPVVISVVFLISRFLLINVYKAVWWDESQYLLMVKHLFLNTPTTGWWSGRSIIYPWLLFILSFPFGFNEFIIRVFNILFGLGFVLSSYYLIKELFNERYAVITGFLMIFHWVFFYWSLRITLGVVSGFLLTVSALLFIRKNNFLSGLFLGFAFTIRFTAGITGVVYLIYDLISKKSLKDYYWVIGVIIGVSPLVFYDVITTGNPLSTPLSFLTFNLNSSGGSQAGDQFYYIATLFFNYGVILGSLFFVGLIALAFKIKSKNVLFISLNLIIYLLFYSLITKVKEVRFLIHLLPFVVITAILGLVLIINSFSKNKKTIFYLLIIISSVIIVENFNSSMTNIFRISNSYLEVRQAGEFLSYYNGSRVMCNSVPQITYYSGKTVDSLPNNYTDFINKVHNYDWLIVSIFEQHPSYAFSINESFIKPVKALPNPNNVKLIIYKVEK